MSNIGKWDHWYEGLTDPQPYGDDTTYKLGADWLATCSTVEDWGCGKGWFRQFLPSETTYVGLDGSHSPFADTYVDLAEYVSHVPGIFMRHVLEHDYRWRDILDNAVQSFQERMTLVLFTPLADCTHEVAWNDNPGVPDLSFSLADITGVFTDCVWRHETLNTNTQYGVETIFYVER